MTLLILERKMPEFFIPFVESQNHEEAYEQIAKFIGAVPRPLAERIYSMTWHHDGVVWTATVGEKIRGTATIALGRGRDRREREVPRFTDDTVTAIFPGLPGLIAHDNKSRYWNLPILTGEAIHSVRFG